MKDTSGLRPPWKKGESGNPGGNNSLPDAFRLKGPAALEAISDMLSSGDDKIRLKAAIWVAERIYGRAAQALELDTGGGMNAVLAALLSRPSDPG